MVDVPDMPVVCGEDWRCVERVACTAHEWVLDLLGKGWRRTRASMTLGQTDFECASCAFNPATADAMPLWEALNTLPTLL